MQNARRTQWSEDYTWFMLINIARCKMHSAQYTLNTALCFRNSVNYMLYIACCTLYSAHYSTRWILHAPIGIPYIACCKMHSEHYTLNTALCSNRNSVHSCTIWILDGANCTLNNKCWILHAALGTPHTKRWTLQAAIECWYYGLCFRNYAH